MRQLIRERPELVFTLAFLATTIAVGAALGLPFTFPAGERAASIGIHYLYPLLGLAIWGGVALFGQRESLTATFFVALPCYAIILLCHFNLKLWIPHINPLLWDGLYWRLDEAARPLVDTCFVLRETLAPLIPLESNFYMVGFITMFYLSFCLHALRDTHSFRTLFLAALLFQGMGAIAYVIMPALGPFVFEAGVEPMQTAAQQGMLEAYRANVAEGAAWIEANGATHLTVGVAAMPSLHTGGSFLFLLFAWRYARVLTPIYVLLFAFIAIDAVASRWHYLIDLPAGVALAWVSAWAAERLNRSADAPSTASPSLAPTVDPNANAGGQHAAFERAPRLAHLESINVRNLFTKPR